MRAAGRYAALVSRDGDLLGEPELRELAGTS